MQRTAQNCRELDDTKIEGYLSLSQSLNRVLRLNSLGNLGLMKLQRRFCGKMVTHSFMSFVCRPFKTAKAEIPTWKPRKDVELGSMWFKLVRCVSGCQ